MGSEVRVQLGLIQAKRRRLPAGHRLLDGLKFLLDLRRRLRAGRNNRRRRGMKNHQQSDNCGHVRRPSYDPESQAQRAKFARSRIIGDSTVAGAAGGIHDAASLAKLSLSCNDPKAAKRLQQENARTGAT
jgi:hypothetical protein